MTSRTKTAATAGTELTTVINASMQKKPAPTSLATKKPLVMTPEDWLARQRQGWQHDSSSLVRDGTNPIYYYAAGPSGYLSFGCVWKHLDNSWRWNAWEPSSQYGVMDTVDEAMDEVMNAVRDAVMDVWKEVSSADSSFCMFCEAT